MERIARRATRGQTVQATADAPLRLVTAPTVLLFTGHAAVKLLAPRHVPPMQSIADTFRRKRE